MYNLSRASLDFGDYDIAKIEALKEKFDSITKTLCGLRDITQRMYRELEKQ